MKTISRRSILKGLMAFAAFIPAAHVLASNRSGSAAQVDPTTRPTPPTPPPPGASMLIEEYASGPAVAVDTDKLVIKTYDRGDVTLHLSSRTEVWENLYVKDIPIEVGDRITAWGPRRADGSHDVEKLWVNLVNLRGTMSNIKRGTSDLQFTLRDTRRGMFSIIIQQQASRVGNGPRENQPCQVVGRKLKDGSVLAVTVYFD